MTDVPNTDDHRAMIQAAGMRARDARLAEKQANDALAHIKAMEKEATEDRNAAQADALAAETELLALAGGKTWYDPWIGRFEDRRRETTVKDDKLFDAWARRTKRMKEQPPSQADLKADGFKFSKDGYLQRIDPGNPDVLEVVPGLVKEVRWDPVFVPASDEEIAHANEVSAGWADRPQGQP